MSQRGRPRTGSLYLTKSGWRVRLLLEVDGEMVRKSVDLGTRHRRVAEIKTRRIVEGGQPVDSALRGENLREASERVVGESKLASSANRLGRLRNHVFERLGDKAVEQVTAADVRDVLDLMAKQGLSQGLCTLVRNDIGAVLGALWRDEVLTENVVQRVKVPRLAAVDRRERAVLTDEELGVYLRWEHPESRHVPAVLERQTMACISRMFGGVRIGDIRALRWESFQIDGGTFAAGWAPRKKTARPQLLAVPEILRPVLRLWWRRAGEPSKGPVFVNRRGPTAGREKGRSNVAEALRRDLRRAFGIEKLIGEGAEARWQSVRRMTARELELFEPGPFTKPVDFHSFRRAYKQGLAEAGLDIQQSMALSGASDVKSHQRYLANTLQRRAVPSAALPSFGRVDGRNAGGKSPKSLWAQLDLNQRLQPCEENAENFVGSQQVEIARDSARAGAPERPENGPDGKNRCQNERADTGRENGLVVPRGPGALQALRDAAHAAVEARNWDLLRALEPLIDAEAKREAPVDLAAVRKRKEAT